MVRVWHSPAPFCEWRVHPDNRHSSAYWKEGKAATLSLLQRNLFHLKVNSKLPIQCHAFGCTTHGYYDLLVSKNPEILIVAMQDNIIIHFYLLNVSGPLSPCSGAKHTLWRNGLTQCPEISGPHNRLWCIDWPGFWGQEEKRQIPHSCRSRNHSSIYSQ